MEEQSHIAPAAGLEAFNCPNCRVYAQQNWYYMKASKQENGFGLQYENKQFIVSNCEKCGFPTIWYGDKIVYPIYNADIAPPLLDTPDDVKEDYEEAKLIANYSPRGASALLRLAIQKLCKHLGLPGKNINDDIAQLVKDGLPAATQKALDSVRVIGNEAVHPGTLDLKDNRESVSKLFRLVNFIVQKTITEPKEIEEIYGGLPTDKLASIAKRDKK